MQVLTLVWLGAICLTACAGADLTAPDAAVPSIDPWSLSPGPTRSRAPAGPVVRGRMEGTYRLPLETSR